jgi:hypothetical protein
MFSEMLLDEFSTVPYAARRFDVDYYSLSGFSCASRRKHGREMVRLQPPSHHLFHHSHADLETVLRTPPWMVPKPVVPVMLSRSQGAAVYAQWQDDARISSNAAIEYPQCDTLRCRQMVNDIAQTEPDQNFIFLPRYMYLRP